MKLSRLLPKLPTLQGVLGITAVGLIDAFTFLVGIATYLMAAIAVLAAGVLLIEKMTKQKMGAGE